MQLLGLPKTSILLLLCIHSSLRIWKSIKSDLRSYILLSVIQILLLLDKIGVIFQIIFIGPCHYPCCPGH